jgi:hypothetical protein
MLPTMKHHPLIALNLALVVLGGACCLRPSRSAADEPQSASLNTLTDAEKQAGWKLLFDGKTTHGWRNFKQSGVAPGWKVIDGALTRAAAPAGDLMTVDQYDSFELSLEYSISREGNSGVLFHVTEELGAPFATGPEVQILDNPNAGDPQKAGWLYQLYPAKVDATKPVGQWNHLRIIVTPQKCETYMNGVKYYEYVKGSKDWDQRVAKSKFAEWPQFGKATRGYIDLQDHNYWVAFRNIKIRPIPTKESRFAFEPASRRGH